MLLNVKQNDPLDRVYVILYYIKTSLIKPVFSHLDYNSGSERLENCKFYD